MPDLSRYDWADGNEAVCLAMIAGRTEDEVIDRYGGDPAAAAPDRSAVAGELDAVLVVSVTGDQVLAVEDNGWQGSRPEVLREVTTGGGRMVSVYWNVNAVSRFALAEDGELLVGFEGLFPSGRDGADPDRLLPLMRRVGYPEPVLDADGEDDDEDDDHEDDDHEDEDDDGFGGRAWRLMLALAEEVTGIAVTSDPVTGPVAGSARAVRLAPLAEDLPTREMLAHAFLRSQDPELAAALDAAGADRLRAAALAAARAALTAGGVAAEPLLLEALSGPPGPVDRRFPVGRLLGGWRADGHRAAMDWTGGSQEATLRMLAGEAVRAALAPDPLIAAWAAADQARVYLPSGAPARAAALAALRA